MPENADHGESRKTPENTAAELKPAPKASELTPSELHGVSPLSAEELVAASRNGAGEELLGQGRAFDAIRMAIGIRGPGYNVFVSGARSREERASVMKLLAEKAATMPTPGDWVYVHNFRNPEAPCALYLKPGKGRALSDAMNELVKSIIDQLPKAFRREDFDQERTALREKYNKRAQELFGGLEQKAREKSFAIQTTPNGQVIFLPLIEGKLPESPEALNKAMQEKTDEQREQLSKAQGELQEEFGSVVLKQQELMRELIDDIRTIERSFAARLVNPLIAEIKAQFDNPGVAAYLDHVAEHILDNLDRFRETDKQQGAIPGMPPQPEESRRWFEYSVNVMVDNSETKGAPVVNEDAPTYRNLFGTIERWIDPLGRSGTNFTRIIGGSYIKSHGGFLVLDMEDAAIEPGVWKALKRSLKSGRVTVETFEPFPFFAVSGLRPESIEVRNKILVLGGPYLYNLLYFYDTDFPELFKVKAEIRPVVSADRAAAEKYASRVGEVVRRENLPPFEGDALARIVQFGMRLAGDRTRMLATMEPIDDLARESAYYAQSEGAHVIAAGHVERALRERMLRLNYIEEEIRRLIANGILIVHLDGKSVGQINGLAVLDVGGYAFGRPSRITATVALGQAGLINIEREARLSGSTHDKGVAILNGFLRNRFGQTHPVAMTASICFEQSYSGIDGDSASSTEIYALLSALSGMPIRQELAVTGSVDQYGDVQAIGGANEKIEGYYRVCKAVGLTGSQGVLVPRANLSNLMLDPETVDAVARGAFHIYPIDNIDRGIELLTGVRAGSLDEPGTINYLVDQRLQKIANTLRDRGDRETRIVHDNPPTPPPPTPPHPPEPPR
ncbi:MAG TPA: AAA family ATPase [Candidatus Binataceae bacterium]|nr:AAA family ATPase [Candidatus Binataceae bacterium]